MVGIILAAGGVGICWRSLQKISEVHNSPGSYAAWPLVGAILIRSIMSTIKFRVGRRIHSSSLVADAWNDAVDILSAAAALLALSLTLYSPSQFLTADHYGGFTVGLVVILTGLRGNSVTHPATRATGLDSRRAGSCRAGTGYREARQEEPGTSEGSGRPRVTVSLFPIIDCPVGRLCPHHDIQTRFQTLPIRVRAVVLI